ncbi:hypothetical protein BJX96DRAFT_12891 [Aspergillus floccosus]
MNCFSMIDGPVSVGTQDQVSCYHSLSSHSCPLLRLLDSWSICILFFMSVQAIPLAFLLSSTALLHLPFLLGLPCTFEALKG